MSFKRTQLLNICAALFLTAGAAMADEPGLVALEPDSGEAEPEVIYHKIVPRDTLWDITEYYLKDPFKWPKVWKFNPYISNPHLIYPGNTVRLTPGGVEILVPDDLKAEGLERVGLEPSESTYVLEPEVTEDAATAMAAEPVKVKGPGVVDSAMERSGFVTAQELDASGAIVAPRERRLYVSGGDEVFVSFKPGSEVKPGSRYTIYSVGRQIKHPDTGNLLGHEIDILGSLTVRKVDGVAEAVIDNSFKEIPAASGARVRPYTEPVGEVEITKASSEVSGFIVTALEGKENLASGDIAYLDKGSAHGLRKGNVMRVFRPVPQVADPMDAGKMVSLQPLELGTVVVIEAGDATSSAVVVESLRPMNWGDRFANSGSN
ncbi:MAG: hypothetical protein IT362_06290 [Deltaproteobacteria bacterium]|nr:hypothetical protein [Deltaproteobacteria bacterium]